MRRACRRKARLRLHGGGLWMATQLKEMGTGKETEQHNWNLATSTPFCTPMNRAHYIAVCLSTKLSVCLSVCPDNSTLYYVHRSQEDFSELQVPSSILVSVHSGSWQWSAVRLRLSSRESGLKGMEGWSGPVPGGQWAATPSCGVLSPEGRI